MSETVHIPQLRFPEFSGDWNRVKIQKLLDDKSIISHLDGNHGALYPRSEEFTKEGVPYVTANDFINGKVDLKKCKCLPVERASQFKKGIAHNGDVLFAHNATVGPVALLETDLEYVVLSTTATYYRCDNNTLINKYLKVYLTSNDFVRQYSRVMSQSTRNQVPITTQRLFYINLPDKPEQQKIAAFLTAVDSKIEQLSKKQELLGEYKKGAMQQIFSQATRFKADDGNEFPDWEEVKLGNLTHKVGKKNKENIKYPIYSINNQEGFRPQSEQFDGLYSNDGCYDISLYKIVNEKTFAYNPARINVGSIGYGYNLNKVIVSSLYVCFKTNDELEDLYLLAYLDTDKFNKDILRYEEGGVRQYLFYENFSQISIPLPGNDEQAKISNFLSSIDNKIEQVDKQLDESKQFKKALLQQMFV